MFFIRIPTNLPYSNPKNINMYDENLSISNFQNTTNYIKFLPRSSSKVLGDSYLTNKTPFNKQYRYDYKFIVGL